MAEEKIIRIIRFHTLTDQSQDTYHWICATHAQLVQLCCALAASVTPHPTDAVLINPVMNSDGDHETERFHYLKEPGEDFGSIYMSRGVMMHRALLRHEITDTLDGLGVWKPAERRCSATLTHHANLVPIGAAAWAAEFASERAWLF